MKQKTLLLLFALYATMAFIACNKDDEDSDSNKKSQTEVKSDTSNGQNDTTDETDKPKGLCPDSNHPHMIDLGIGTLWSCCNVGASKPEQYGSFYCWGETKPKTVYNEVTYKYFTGNDIDGDGRIDQNFSVVNIGSDISGTQYDAARANWGTPWRMPTLEECKALIDHCTSTWTSVNGVAGRMFTGANGNSIFLPAAGDKYHLSFDSTGEYGGYWSSKLYESFQDDACCLSFNGMFTTNGEKGVPKCDGNGTRACGMSVRPVCSVP